MGQDQWGQKRHRPHGNIFEPPRALDARQAARQHWHAGCSPSPAAAGVRRRQLVATRGRCDWLSKRGGQVLLLPAEILSLGGRDPRAPAATYVIIPWIQEFRLSKRPNRREAVHQHSV